MQKPVHFTTPCGFEIWLIPIPAMNTLKIRVFFGADEISMDRVSGRLSRDGAVMMAAKINELYGGTNG